MSTSSTIASPSLRSAALCVALACALSLAASRAHAEVPPAPAPAVAPSATPGAPFVGTETLTVEQLREVERAEFSGLRMVGELLVGAAVGGAAAYGTYKGMCGNEACVGGFLVGATVNLTATTAAVWGTGKMFGGRGSFKAALYGTLIPFAATAPFSANYPLLAFSISMALVPVTSALFYEGASNMTAREMRERAAHTTLMVPFVAPVTSSASVTGALAGVGGVF